MNEKKLKQLNILVKMIVTAGVIVAGLFVFVFAPDNDNRINNDSLKDYSSDWVLKQYRDTNDVIINLPENVKADSGEIILIMKRVPNEVNSSTVLMFKTNFQNVIVMIGDRQVYSNGVLNNQKLMKNIVPCYNIVDIGSAKVGDIISIYLVSGYKNFGGKLPEIYYGTRGDAITGIFRHNGVGFVCALILLVITIILSISLMFMKNVNVDKRRAGYGFGFLLSAGIWALLSSPIMQLITSNTFGVYMTGMVLLLLLPVLYIMYERCFAVKRRYAKIFEGLLYLFSVNFLTGIIFQLFGVCDFATYMIFTKILICVGLVLLSVIMYLAADTFSDKTIYSNLWVNILLTVSCLLEGLLSFFDFYSPYDGVVLETGLLVFMVLMVIAIEKSVLAEMNKERQTAATGVEMEKNVLLNRINTRAIYASLNQVINDLKPIDKTESRFVYDTSMYLKHNLDTIVNRGMVPFETELEYIRAYLGMMGRQHDSLEIVIEDKVVQFDVPYNSIEPLVENAVINGALRAVSGGKLVVRSYERLDCFAIQIVDNGPGIGPDKRFSGKEGYKDIKHRLKNMCGAGVEIKTKPEKGTIITVKVPKEGYIIKE
ncbi:MAG: hypothetical protein ACI4D8_01280 [Wujia sp.]